MEALTPKIWSYSITNANKFTSWRFLIYLSIYNYRSTMAVSACIVEFANIRKMTTLELTWKLDRSSESKHYTAISYSTMVYRNGPRNTVEYSWMRKYEFISIGKAFQSSSTYAFTLDASRNPSNKLWCPNVPCYYIIDYSKYCMTCLGQPYSVSVAHSIQAPCNHNNPHPPPGLEVYQSCTLFSIESKC